MSQTLGLVRAHLLEYRASMIWTPIVIAVLIAVVVLYQLLINTNGLDIQLGELDLTIDDTPLINEETRSGVAAGIAAAFGILSLPNFFIANTIAFFVLLSALYDERQDRTVLFFKSMPVSDTKAVLVKYVSAALIGPLIAVGVMVGLVGFLSIATALIFSMRGVEGAWGFLADLPLLRLFISYSAFYVLSALWLAPIFSFVLMVSALAPRTPFLLAILPVGVLAIGEAILLSGTSLLREIGSRALGIDLMNVIEANREDLAMETAGFSDYFIRLSDIALTLAQPSLWIGLVLAGLFLTVAIWARSRRTL